MKVGDIVMSTKIRSYENATIVKAEYTRFVDDKGKQSVKTKYIAEFADGSSFIFHGANVNKSVFKVQENDGQMCLSDFMNLPIYEEAMD